MTRKPHRALPLPKDPPKTWLHILLGGVMLLGAIVALTWTLLSFGSCQ